MFLYFVATTHAYTRGIVCGAGLGVTGMVPSPGAEDVPVDLRPAITFGSTCGQPGAWSASLVGVSDGAEVGVASADDIALGQTHLLELFPDAPLEPDTAYTFALVPELGEALSFGFTTGTHTVAGLTGAPTLTLESARFTPWRGGWPSTLEVTIQAAPATDPDALSVLQVKDANGDLAIDAFVAPTSGAAARLLTWTDVDDPGEVCLQVRQIDGVGVATDWSAPDCVKVPPCGCSTGGAFTGGLGLLLAPLVLLRRSRGADGAHAGGRVAESKRRGGGR
ncbi:MAG: Ig-like domain-containing protein [Myxococcota bacterium]